MKILVVSAHYPPNFVSGGTLAPQRVARGLRRCGNDVEVFAGWLGDRDPLETWTEVDAVGMPVHWVVTTPWTAWNDERNFENLEVGTVFEEVLDRMRPDLVHFHSLQTLGANLVSSASAAGIATVVTMHDFWWSCGRQFLVRRDFVPCCPVVDAGACPCEVDNGWLRRRNDRLRAHLDAADLVLAVSRSSRDLLEANGIGAGRLELDENGLEAPAAARSERHVPAGAGTGAGPVRLLFAGGGDRMKGGHVLLEALRRLDRPGRWTLAAYGLRGLAEEVGALDALPEITWFDGYRPNEAPAVFAASDVVVVPSVMRESHSLLTREALLHGRPVVVTDTFGPEEVVVHGHNGLIVPAGDADALAGAIRSLIDDSEALASLAASADAVEVRSLDDQVRALDRRFEELLDQREQQRVPGRGPTRQMIGSVLFIVGIEGAPLRYRARLPAEALGLLGVRTDVRHYRDPEAWRLAFEADAVVVYRVPATEQVLQLLEELGRKGTPRFFDVDDLIFDPELQREIPALQILAPEEAALWLQGVERYRTTMEACDAYIGSTEALCAHAREVVGLPAFRFPNGVGLELGRLSDLEVDRDRAPGPIRIGYLSGTDTHDHDWRFVEPAIVRFLDHDPTAELWLGGLLRTTEALQPYEHRTRRLPLVPWIELPGVLRDLDVNLAPLEPGSRFNEAKSAIKWLESALVGTPTIASGTQPFRESIRHGENGFLADDVDEWFERLVTLAEDPLLRRRLGTRARRDALLRWSPHRQATRYLEILTSALPPKSARPGPWSPVALDEPWAPGPIPLDPYVVPSTEPATPLPEPHHEDRAVGRRAAVVARAGLRSIRTDGLVPTGRRSIAWTRRRWPRAKSALLRARSGSR